MYMLSFLFLIFYNVIETYAPMGNYWDELTAFLVLCWGGYAFRRDPQMSKGERNGWISLALLIVIGVLGNVFHPGLQTKTVVLFKDVVALSKFPVIFFILQRRAVMEERQEAIVADIAKVSRWILLVTLAAVILGRFVDLGFYTGEVRIVPTFEFVFSHPTFYISSYVMIAAALIADSLDKNRLYLLLDCFLLFMAQRSKGYIFIAFLALFILLGEDRITKILTALLGNAKEKTKPFRLILAVVLVVLMILVVGKSRIEETLNLGFPVPRIVLHVVGIKILLDFFPLGSGLGTFASYLSGRDYSNIYEMYGISNVIGMTREKYNFISDVFWPYIYGQFGIFGLLIYLKLIISIFFRQYYSNLTNASRIAMVTVWIYALIASTSEAYFTNGTGVQMAVFLGIFIGYGSQNCLRSSRPSDG